MLFCLFRKVQLVLFRLAGAKVLIFYYKYCIFSRIYSILLPLQPQRMHYVKKETRTAHN